MDVVKRCLEYQYRPPSPRPSKKKASVQKILHLATQCWESIVFLKKSNSSRSPDEELTLANLGTKNGSWYRLPQAQTSTEFQLCWHLPVANTWYGGYVGTVQKPLVLLKAWNHVFPSLIS